MIAKRKSSDARERICNSRSSASNVVVHILEKPKSLSPLWRERQASRQR